MSRAPDPGRELGGGFPGGTLAAELALGVLDAAERAAAEARAAVDPAFAAEAADWSARLHPLAEEAASAPPPPSLWGRIAAALPEEAAGGPRPSAAASPRLVPVAPTSPAATAAAPLPADIVALEPRRQVRRWRRVAGFATALAAACVVAVVVLASRHPLAPQPLLTARLEPPAGESALVGEPLYAATLDRGRGSVLLTPVGPGPVDPRVRELWVIPAGKGAAPLPAGLIERGRTSPLRLKPDVLARAGAGASLAVSLEPDGGSPTGSPTGPVIASGVLAGV